MKKYDTALGRVVDAPVPLYTPEGLKPRPSTTDYEAAGLYDYVAFDVPEGYVRVADTQSFTQVNGVWVESWETITVDAYELQFAAEAAEQQAILAAADANAYSGEISKVLSLSEIFQTIIPGMSYTQISAVMATEMQSAQAAGNTDLYMRMDMAKDIARDAYTRVLEPAGVTGDRFWRAAEQLIQ